MDRLGTEHAERRKKTLHRLDESPSPRTRNLDPREGVTPPHYIHFRNQTFHFNMVVPITGDWVYESYDDKHGHRFALVTNPNVREHQTNALLRMR